MPSIIRYCVRVSLMFKQEGYCTVRGKPVFVDSEGKIHPIKTDRVLLKSQAKELLKRVPLTGYFNEEEVKIIQGFLNENS